MSSRYTIGDPVTKLRHPDVPDDGFASAIEACLWAEARDLTAWAWWVLDHQPARFEGIA